MILLPTKKQEAKSGSRGFTLIELLIVMVIIGLLASLVAPTMFKKVGGAKRKTARAQIELLGTALDSYRLDNDVYPSSEQGLQALRNQPDGAKNWDGPYLPKDLPKDPWGNDYVYKSPGDHGDYDLSSYGVDGQPGGEDDNADINSWEN
ncbi:MAG: type II secretion system major pseudopilin GspG [Deltaproteobacteria bacterium]|nr:type II secretion system major pseudopilin GspG [Deltaproteobacteria bacterium]